MLNEVDEDGNGDIDLVEFKRLMNRKMKQGDPEEELAEAFKIFDRNGNGIITSAELKEVMSVLGEECSDEELSVMMNIADPDGNNMISFDEFVICYNRLLEEYNSKDDQ